LAPVGPRIHIEQVPTVTRARLVKAKEPFLPSGSLPEKAVAV